DLAANFSTYCGMLRRVSSTKSGVAFISTLAWTGPLACSARSAARPSQNWATLNTAFNTVGELRGPCCQPWPTEVGILSAPPVPTLWQVLQVMMWLLDRRGSNHSHWPSSICSGVRPFSLITTSAVGMGLKRLLASVRSSSMSLSAAMADEPMAKADSTATVRRLYMLYSPKSEMVIYL